MLPKGCGDANKNLRTGHIVWAALFISFTVNATLMRINYMFVGYLCMRAMPR